MSRLCASTLEGLRYCVRPEYAGLPDEDLQRIVESSISGLPNDTAEDFLSTLGSVGKSVAPVLQRAAPDVAQGAAAGSTFGPWGAVIGAGAGLASSLLKSQGKPAPAAAPARPTGVPATPSAPAVAATPPATAATPAAPEPPSATPAPPSATAAPPALPTGQGAAATLLNLFQNPTVQQALLTQVLGSSGSQEVQAGSGASIPRGAINDLLSQLLTHASEALPESESISEQSYLQNGRGEYLIDPASFDQQAALVLSHLQLRPPVQLRPPAELYETIEWISEGGPDIESEEWAEVDETSETVSFY